MVILWQDCCGKGNSRKFLGNTIWRKFVIENVSMYTVRKDISCMCTWMTSNGLERKHLSDVENTQQTIRFENQHHSSIMSTWDELKDNVKQAKILSIITEPRSNPEFPQEQRKITKLGSNEYFYVVLRYGRSCKEIVVKLLRVGEQKN